MKRILCVLPIPYGPNWGFWTRDAGLTVLTLRDMGYDAWLVALGDETTDTTNRPVIALPVEELSRPEWWQAQKPDAVMLSTGSAPRHDAMRKAALSVTPRVVERLDTSGARSARLFPWAVFIQTIGAYQDRLPAYAHGLAVLAAAARTALLYAFPQLMDERMVATMRRLPAMMAESPIAVERMQRMCQTFSGHRHRIALIPHPINEAEIHYDGTPKENLLITIGRWESYQKDYPLLRKIIQGFLERHPDWKAMVVGRGLPEADLHPQKITEEWRTRVTFHAKLEHVDLAKAYNRSKIYLMASRYESFCIAAAEQLCSGGSVVGSCDVPTSYYFSENQGGRVADPRTLPSFLDTLDAEVHSWAQGERDPESISALALSRTGTSAVAKAMKHELF